MRILADDRIEQAREAFDDLGELELCAGHEIDSERVAKVQPEVLIIRSTCRVDEELLTAATALKIIATATIGTDHVDLEALKARDIAFVSAAGSSAKSVAQFTWALIHRAMTHLERPWMHQPQPLKIAVLGAGDIGRRVADSAAVFGLEALYYDPPKALWDQSRSYCERGELAAADIVSMHLPYCDAGDFSTEKLVNAEFLKVIKDSALLLNTGRGKTLDGQATLAALDSKELAALVLDVFPNEPEYDADLATAAILNCPHLAGRSVDGMLANTEKVRDGLRQLLGPTATTALGPAPSLRLPPLDPGLFSNSNTDSKLDEFGRFVDGVWGAQFERNDAAMRASADLSAEARGKLFRELRQISPRRDLTAWRDDERLGPKLRALLTTWSGVLT